MSAAAPEMISISSLVMTDWRVRLNVIVNLSIISPAQVTIVYGTKVIKRSVNKHSALNTTLHLSVLTLEKNFSRQLLFYRGQTQHSIFRNFCIP